MPKLSSEEARRRAKKKEPKKIYECSDFIIEEIPHNYRATIKCACNPKEQWRGIDRDLYTHPEHGLEYCKEVAKEMVSKWFLSGVAPSIPESLKSS